MSSPRVMEMVYGSGSSELPSEREVLSVSLPDGWGKGVYDQGSVRGCCREAPIHPETHQPLGVGCRWERRYLDSLEEKVLVVAGPPRVSELWGYRKHTIVLLFVILGYVGAGGFTWTQAHLLDTFHNRLVKTACVLAISACLVYGLYYVICSCRYLCYQICTFRQMEPLRDNPDYLTRGSGKNDSAGQDKCTAPLLGSALES